MVEWWKGSADESFLTFQEQAKAVGSNRTSLSWLLIGNEETTP